MYDWCDIGKTDVARLGRRPQAATEITINDRVAGDTTVSSSELGSGLDNCTGAGLGSVGGVWLKRKRDFEARDHWYENVNDYDEQ